MQFEQLIAQGHPTFRGLVLEKEWILDNKPKDVIIRGQHSTEVAYMILTQLPRVLFCQCFQRVLSFDVANIY